MMEEPTFSGTSLFCVFMVGPKMARLLVASGASGECAWLGSYQEERGKKTIACSADVTQPRTFFRKGYLM